MMLTYQGGNDWVYIHLVFGWSSRERVFLQWCCVAIWNYKCDISASAAYNLSMVISIDWCMRWPS